MPKLVPCEDCGRLIPRKANHHRPQLCTEHGIARVIENARQQRAREGPYYERWLAASGAVGRPRSTHGGKR